jgi:hypothetical protein
VPERRYCLTIYECGVFWQKRTAAPAAPFGRAQNIIMYGEKTRTPESEHNRAHCAGSAIGIIVAFWFSQGFAMLRNV